ncbi:MAG: hypothetical protein Q9169_007591 [Polycauliona sp. 2 TL-2023]
MEGLLAAATPSSSAGPAAAALMQLEHKFLQLQLNELIKDAKAEEAKRNDEEEKSKEARRLDEEQKAKEAKKAREAADEHAVADRICDRAEQKFDAYVAKKAEKKKEEKEKEAEDKSVRLHNVSIMNQMRDSWARQINFEIRLFTRRLGYMALWPSPMPVSDRRAQVAQLKNVVELAMATMGNITNLHASAVDSVWRAEVTSLAITNQFNLHGKTMVNYFEAVASSAEAARDNWVEAEERLEEKLEKESEKQQETADRLEQERRENEERMQEEIDRLTAELQPLRALYAYIVQQQQRANSEYWASSVI